MSAQELALGAFVEGALQQQGADGAAEALAQLERELAETERAVELEGAALQATLDEGVAAVAGQRGAEGAAFVDPFRRAGSLFSGAHHTPSLFVEEAEELGAASRTAAFVLPLHVMQSQSMRLNRSEGHDIRYLREPSWRMPALPASWRGS